ncbi:hypothetical protein C7S16_0777 [Burkholderia thailandensis]|uniref:Uncharacterized protein n=1 Tax=Burkholderia thailandensis TaxID=57975 RepID=A0AAW9CWE5_BURTH|nr:hypothetical protein [Burkholderia thailandensis]MDW9254226.1 hypothetical protein [Burkholderia thailandensis]
MLLAREQHARKPATRARRRPDAPPARAANPPRAIGSALKAPTARAAARRD